MITSAQEYLARLQELRDANLHTETILIPEDEQVYNVDLNARTIDSPVYLSTETDHIAETVFFKVDRYFETYDLSKATCIIQYINAKNEPHTYLVPIYDLEHYAEDGKMLIPWVIQGPATAAAGNIKYAIRLYHLNKTEGLDGKAVYDFDYIINTQIATSKILKGMGETYLDDMTAPLEEVATVEDWEALFHELSDLRSSGDLKLYWTVL